MLPFIRSDLAQLTAYTANPGGTSGEEESSIALDRLDANESPYDLPDELKQKLAWIHQQAIETNRYPDGGHEVLKAAIAQYVNESAGSEANFSTSNATTIIAENISVGNGSDELIRSVLIATCLKGEGAILTANPTFSMYAIIAETLGIPVVNIERSPINFEIDLAVAQTAIDRTKNPPVRVIFVVHPNSPTANALTDAELAWLRTLPEEILVVIDEAYFEFSQKTVIQELHQHPNWIVLRTFSKAFRLAAMRVGYAIAHPELIAALEKIRLPYNLPSFSQAATQIALANWQQLQSSIPETIAERTKLIAALSQHQKLQVWPSDANFLYLRIKDTNSPITNEDYISFMQQLKAKGTLIRHTGGGLRITIGTPDENQRTIERIQAIL